MTFEWIEIDPYWTLVAACFLWAVTAWTPRKKQVSPWESAS